MILKLTICSFSIIDSLDTCLDRSDAKQLTYDSVRKYHDKLSTSKTDKEHIPLNEIYHFYFITYII
jgi:hypothetical protein